MGSLKDFFDDIIPNEIKDFANTPAGKVILGGTAAYLGVKYAPSANRALFGTPMKVLESGTEAGTWTVGQTSGLLGTGGFRETVKSTFGIGDKYGGKGVLGRMAEEKGGFLGGASKFIKGMGEDKLSGMMGYESGTAPTMASQIQSVSTTRGVKGQTGTAVGSYGVTKTGTPGFNNSSVQSAMANIVKYYNDIAMGRIPSESYSIESTRGTTIGIPKGSTTIGRLT